MGLIKAVKEAVKWNTRYVKVINSCDWNGFVVFMDDLTRLDHAFRQKRYLWNIIRGKTFYKDLSHYVIKRVEMLIAGDIYNSDEWMNKIEMILHEVVTTEKSERALKGFIWAVTKKVPLLTVDIIPYMSGDRVTNILMSEKQVLNDSSLDPFIKTVTDLRKQITDLTGINNTLSSLIGDE